MKANGIVYNYYRCSDGKRVHRQRGEPQVNVREEDILEQLGGAVDAIQITADIATAIAHELNETHRTAMKEKARSAAVYREEIKTLEEKEDRLFDRFDAGDIDRPTYDRQLARLRAEKDDRFAKLREADTETDSAYLVTAQRVLELARNARSLWEARNASEKRDFLASLVCNSRLDGRSVRFDLKKPFDVLAKMTRVEGWRPRRDSNLRPPV